MRPSRRCRWPRRASPLSTPEYELKLPPQTDRPYAVAAATAPLLHRPVRKTAAAPFPAPYHALWRLQIYVALWSNLWDRLFNALGATDRIKKQIRSYKYGTVESFFLSDASRSFPDGVRSNGRMAK
ncbi:hypothetical protein GWI33_007313 [Rhynchophorus ferrugineus]|uniref:Uncharacterized protein n=1 Tax=Rhynchophorus ferrugineus TaxID=354439 RepID=A0A834IKG6_RHYFE|nr:hypothetical protein GWI33_007313 [Rhynchophorus ferrugineus]